LGEIAPIIKNLGAKHVPMGVKKEHYPIAINAVLKFLKDNLGDEFTPTV
jgi:hemoglobin-like flavoprotein